MISKISRFLVALMATAVFAPVTQAATATEWTIDEVFSNADGTIQYIEMSAQTNDQDQVSGLTLTSVDGATASQQIFTFPSNLPSTTTGGKTMLLATAGFESAIGIAPDFVIPDGFLTINNGSLQGIANNAGWTQLPTDDINAGYWQDASSITTSPMSPKNLAGDAFAPEQVVAASSAVIGAQASSQVSIEYTYNTVLPNPNLTGLGVKVFFDSTQVTANSVSNVLSTGQIGSPQLQADDSDLDGDASTDYYYTFAWADINGTWPGTLPQSLFTLNLTTASGFTGTTINITGDTASGFVLNAPPVSLVLDATLPTISGVPQDTTFTSSTTIPSSDSQIVDLFAGVSCTDDTDANPTLSIGLPSGFPVGATTPVAISCTDSAGNEATATVNVTVTQLGGIASDADGDGISDILLRNVGSGGWYEYLVAGDGTFKASQSVALTTSSFWKEMGTADFNGDGSADVLLRNSSGGWYAYLMNGNTVVSGSTLTALTSDTSYVFAAAADTNADGNADILLHNSSSGHLYLMNGLTVISDAELTGIPVTTTTEFEALADFNGDGKADILLRDSASGSWTLCPLDGTTVGSCVTFNAPVDTDKAFVTAADVDGDGKAEVILRSVSTGQWQVYDDQDGSTTNLAATNDRSWKFAMNGDFNGDGSADLLIRNESLGSWYVYYLNGAQIVGSTGLPATSDKKWVAVGGADVFPPSLSVPAGLVLTSSTTVQFGDTSVQEWLAQATCTDTQDASPTIGYAPDQMTIDPDTYISVLFECQDAAGNMTTAGSTIQVTAPVAQYSVLDDFSGDGQSDLLLRNFNGSWHYYDIQNSQVALEDSFTDTSYADYTGLATVDFNGDGTADILARSSSGAWSIFYMSNQDVVSTDTLGLTTDKAWEFQGVGDINGDGAPDILIRNSGSHSWYAYMMQGATVSSAGSISATTDKNWEFVALADLNGDGYDELIIRNASTGGWYTYGLNGAQVTSGSGLSLTSDRKWQVKAVRDFDGDGNADVLIRYTTGSWYLYMMDGTSVKQAGSIAATTDTAWEFVRAGDYNGDNSADILLRNSGSGSWYLYSMYGTQIIAKNSLAATTDKAFKLVTSSAPQTTSAKVVPHDLNGDGRSDILIRYKGASWYVYQMNGSTITSGGSIAATSDTSWVIKSDADFNGDGKADLLIRNSSSHSWYVYLMDGNSIIGKGSINATTDASWQFVAANDLNGDGKADILIRNASSGAWYAYMMNGSSVVSKGSINATTDRAWVLQSLTDLDADGKADILLRNSSSGAWYRYFMNGTTIANGASISATKDRNWAFQGVGDFDGDGIGDILIRNGTYHTWYIYELSATGIKQGGSLSATTDANWQLKQIGDFDGDGKSDLLIRHATTHAWYLYRLSGTSIASGASINATKDGSWQSVP